MSRETNKRNELLEKEYFHLYSVVENFDAKSLNIKAWSVTLAVGIAGAGAFTEHKSLLIFASIASFLFWLIDGYWKTFQISNYRRLHEIEEYYSGKIDNINCLQISSNWYKSYRTDVRKRLVIILFWPHIFLPHGAMTLGFGAWYLVWRIYT